MSEGANRGYRPRVADAELQAGLRRAGAVLIEGVRACGKTETAQQAAGSAVHLDRDPATLALAAIDPVLVLDGETPRLIDEWQLAPQLWNAVRGQVDGRKAPGQFILTGSSAPSADAARHTGAGRFARLRMRTMTMVETGFSTGEVSLEALLNAEAPRATDAGLSFATLTERLVVGGWPGYQDLAPSDASRNLADYLETIASVDLHSLDGQSRDPVRVMRLLTALARSTATEVTISTLARDEVSMSRDAVREYLAALERIFVVENQPAWATHLRSSATLRKEPKRHFADPSLAAAALRAYPEALRRDPAFTGQLFESLVVHDLRVFSAPLGGVVQHARDSAGREVDAIIALPDGSWAGFEVKLGSDPTVIDGAAAGLVAFAAQVSPPVALTVIASSGPSYRRTDGVNVVAIGSLGR